MTKTLRQIEMEFTGVLMMRAAPIFSLVNEIENSQNIRTLNQEVKNKNIEFTNAENELLTKFL